MSADYCVYQHIFPNGKQYIGMSNNVSRRWKNGEGYTTNHEMYKAIQKYGWGKIEHNIIQDGLTRNEAQNLEKQLIENLGTIKNGYNKAKGGQSGKSYFSTHVLKVLNKARQYVEFNNYCKAFYSFSDDEEVAIHLNFLDLCAKKHKILAGMEGDERMYCASWFSMILDMFDGKNINDPNYKAIRFPF